MNMINSNIGNFVKNGINIHLKRTKDKSTKDDSNINPIMNPNFDTNSDRGLTADIAIDSNSNKLKKKEIQLLEEENKAKTQEINSIFGDIKNFGINRNENITPDNKAQSQSLLPNENQIKPLNASETAIINSINAKEESGNFFEKKPNLNALPNNNIFNVNDQLQIKEFPNNNNSTILAHKMISPKKQDFGLNFDNLINKLDQELIQVNLIIKKSNNFKK